MPSDDDSTKPPGEESSKRRHDGQSSDSTPNPQRPNPPGYNEPGDTPDLPTPPQHEQSQEQMLSDSVEQLRVSNEAARAFRESMSGENLLDDLLTSTSNSTNPATAAAAAAAGVVLPPSRFASRNPSRPQQVASGGNVNGGRGAGMNGNEQCE